MDSFINLLQQLLPTVVGILALPLVILATLLVRKGLQRLGLSQTAEIENLVVAIVNQGVKYAEQEAARLAAEGDEADSGTKMEIATTFILAQIEALGLEQMASDELVRRIEAAVGEMNNS